MKCDVCDTKIPIGGHQCPNCGYKMPVKKVNPFNMNSTNHEHIEGSVQNNQQKRTSFAGTEMSMQAKMEELKKDPRNGFDFLKLGGTPESGKVVKVIIKVIITLVLIVFSTKIITSIIDYNQYENLTFQEVIDEGYDDGSTQKALVYKNKIVDEFKKLGINELNIDEYCEDNEGFRAHTIVQGYYQGVSYQVSGSFNENKQVTQNLFIDGDSKISLIDEFQGNKEVISQLGKVLGSDKLVKVIDESRTQLIPSEDDTERILVYRTLNPNIYITQNNEGSEDLYHFTIMYDN